MAWIAPPGFKAGLERPAARRRILRPVLMHRRSLSNRASHGGRGGFALRNLFEDWGHTLRDFCREVNGGETTWRHSKNRANPSFTRLAGSDHRRKTPSRVPNSSASASGILCGWAVLRTCSPEITGRSTGCFDTLMRIQPASPRRQCRMKSPGESSNRRVGFCRWAEQRRGARVSRLRADSSRPGPRVLPPSNSVLWANHGEMTRGGQQCLSWGRCARFPLRLARSGRAFDDGKHALIRAARAPGQSHSRAEDAIDRSRGSTISANQFWKETRNDREDRA